MLLAEIKTIFRKELKDIYPNEEVDAFFYQLIEHYLGLERFVLVMRPAMSITKEEEKPLFEALAQLKLEKPIQYILGEVQFMDLKLKVNEHVLIPRPETAELVHWVVQEVINRKPEIRILDIGTGSGCIAIALARKFPDTTIDALDISEKALEVARTNAASNEVRVNFLHGNILNPKHSLTNRSEYDLVVSNPPYVREKEKKEIRKNVKNFEPSQALFVPDENPLLFYKAIAKFSQNCLKSNGKLFLEINQYLAKETEQLLQNHNFKDVKLQKDIFGNFRMIKGVKK